MFLRHPGRLLTKEELLQAVWPDTTVEEANLTVNVSTLRRLLAGGGALSCIETVPRRGYRFLLPVEVEQTPGRTPPARGATGPPARGRRSSMHGPIRRRTKPITGRPRATSIRPASTRRPISRRRGHDWRAAIA